MIDRLIVWETDYIKRVRGVDDILTYHHILPEDSFRAEGRIQAADSLFVIY
ncbi:hypothetical protein J2Z69_000724 [Paenibacillus shirakamiensis]|uniref:Uncharacterized protein n=1 Tax=Paenibacillus shirakamiensis TaxID=1265935 RepID=A0ABS4JF61_9BACL|nr:hypothetical protein [Paenibacillus shirakamiensis]